MRPHLKATIVWIVCAGPLLAQSASQRLSLKDCLNLAEGVQSSLSLARQETEIALRGEDRARASFLPKFLANNAFTYNSPLLSNRDDFSFIALNGFREYSSQLTAVQDLDISGRLRAELERARADRDASAANLALSRRDLKKAVSTSYYRVLLARHLVQSARDALAEAQSFAARTQLLFDQGEAAQADVFKASSEVAFREQNLSAAELEAEVANHELASFWTDAVGDALSLEDPLEQPIENLESQAGTEGATSTPAPYLQRPEFNLIDAHHRGYIADARKAHADLLPQASLTFQYGIDSQHVRIADRGYAAFVSLDIPIFDWFRTRNLEKQFKVKAQQLETTRAAATRSFSKEYQDALSRLKSLIQQARLAEKQVQLSVESLRTSRLRYEGGEGTALEVVTALNQLAQARANYYMAFAGGWNAKIDLEVATGR